MSPEALFGEAPHASFDLWSLSLVLYETMAGRNPLHEPSMQRTRARILTGDVPDIRLHVPAAPPQLADFFRRAFSSEATDRAATAAVLRDRLRAIRGAMVAAQPDVAPRTVSTSS
jgi:serine/threonine-protein kinase